MRRLTKAEQDELAHDSDYHERIDLLPQAETHRKERVRDWKDDKWNILLLLFLYTLQGIPLGLGGSMPMILQNRKITYKQQALFSFVHWPFSMKLLWAPIVDSLYWTRMGRRKTWLIPTQYLIGLFMILLSYHVSSLLGENGAEPNVELLTVAFFSMNVLAATQDIAVDGWALTMLSRHNVGFASTCNSVGQTAGFFLGNVVFLALESADFCNSYLRSVPQSEGIVTASSFLMFWAYVFLLTTTLVAFFKKDKEKTSDTRLKIVSTYKMLFRVLLLPNVLKMIAFLMTCKIGFAATDALTSLKFIEAGVQRENLAFLAIPIVPLQIILPLVISRYTAGPKPLSVFVKAYPYRLMCGMLYSCLLSWTYFVKWEEGGFPAYYYAVILIVYGAHQVTVYCIFVALMAFFAKVSDPAIGGTYMTLLNTICNLGGNWPSTLALWGVEYFTWKRCENAPHISCDTRDAAVQCGKDDGPCVTTVEGYYVETAFCITVGFLWMKWGFPLIRRLQHAPASSWVYS